MTNDLTLRNDEEKELLSQAKSEVATSKRLPPFPQIKLLNVKATSPSKEIAVGDYYIEESSYNSDTKEREKHITPLGNAPELIIVKKRMTYSYYDKEEEKLVAWTNELDAFAPEQIVHIALNDGSSAHIVASISKQEFKDAKNAAKFKKSKMEPLSKLEMICSNMKFRNVVYLWSPETKKGYRMFVSNASTTGVPDGEAKYGSYDEPQPGSFSEFQNRMTAEEPEVLFKSKCVLGSRGKKDPNGELEYYLMTFTEGEKLEPEEFTKMLYLWKDLSNELDIRLQTEFLSMGATPKDNGTVIETALPELD